MTFQRDRFVGDAEANIAVISDELKQTANSTQLPGFLIIIHIRYCATSGGVFIGTVRLTEHHDCLVACTTTT